MARKRLALVAFEKGEGVWVNGKGDESAVWVTQLLEGEQIWLEVDGLSDTTILQTGLSPVSIPKGAKYRFVKTVPDGLTPSKTCVEVIINEPSRSKADAGEVGH